MILYNWLNNINISKRLSLTFGFILLFGLVLGYFSLSSINSLTNRSEMLYKHPFAVSNAVREIKIGIVSMHRSIKDVAFSSNIEELSKARIKVEQYEVEVLENFDLVFERYLGDQADIQNAYEKFLAWKSIREEVISFRENNNIEKAVFITKNKGANHVNELLDSINLMVEFAKNMADKFHAQSTRSEQEARLIIVSLVIGLSLFLALLSVFIVRTINDSIKNISYTIDSIEKGDLTKRIKINSKDELADLAVMFNNMTESLQKRNNFLKNIHHIPDSVVGVSSLSVYVNKLLKSIYEISKSNIGVFYIKNEQDNSFSPAYSIGADRNLFSNFDSNKPLSEMDIAIQTMKVSLFKNVDADSKFKFTSSIGDFQAEQIITIPLVVNNEVYGLISLAKTSPFSNSVIELLNYVHNNLNNSFETIIANEKTQVLAKELESKNIELEKQSFELTNQSKELQAISEELKVQNKELERNQVQVNKVNKLKSEFISNMSHELRTPLNSIMALSKVLFNKSNEKLDETELEYLQIINRNGKQLLALINDILDLSKIESGKFVLSQSAFDLKENFANIVSDLKILAEQKNIYLTLKVKDDLPKMNSDLVRVNQIMHNLIGNAIKFTDKGGITVEVSDSDESIIINIKDTGIGINQDKINEIFDDFIQIDGSSSRKYEGTGLGLAISKKLAELLGGNISVVSEENVGTTFTVILPIELPDSENLNGPLSIKNNSIEENNSEVLNTGIKKKILIVEDNEIAISQIRMVLEEAQYEVAVAKGGQQAIDFVDYIIPDGIILDLMMPDVDGFDVLEKMRSSERTYDIPVLVLTAKDLTKEDFQKLSNNNIQQLVQKGDIDVKSLLFKIELMLSKNKTEKIKNNVLSNSLKQIRKNGKPDILLIEDNNDNQTTIKAIIGDLYDLTLANNGEEGISIAKSTKPGLILLDLALPKIDGYEVFRILRSNECTKHIPIIAVSAMAIKERVDKLLDLGFDDYLSKPIDSDLLISKIKKFIG